MDFPAVFKVLRDRHYKGWVIFDVDGPRKGDDGFDSIGGNLDLAVDDYFAHNINYLRNILGVKLPPPVAMMITFASMTAFSSVVTRHPESVFLNSAAVWPK